jgi:predicted Zn-dependent protease
MSDSFISASKKDEELSRLLNEFVGEINFNTSYPITITAVKSEEVNAFALPGGTIVVFDKILREINSAEELAALLSHEVAHIEYRHSLKSLSRSISGYIFVSLLFNDINGVTTALVDNANTLNNLSFSRSLEAEADNRALKTLDDNRLSQKGLVDLFETLDAEDSYNFLKFLSTHPLTRDRIQSAKVSAAKQRLSRKNARLDHIWLKIQSHVK